jgi:hypothetical protein
MMSTHVESIGCVRECETEVELPWAANSCPCVVEAANRVTIYCWCPETVRCSWCLSSVASSAQHKHGPVRIIVSARSLCLPGRLIKRVCSGVGGWGCGVAWKDSRPIGRGGTHQLLLALLHARLLLLQLRRELALLHRRLPAARPR